MPSHNRLQVRRVLTLTPQTTSLAALRARQPKELLQTDIFQEVPPEDLTPTTLAKLATAEVMTNPARVLQVYMQHAEQGDPDISVLIRAFVQLGFLFDPNSYFATADKQILTGHPKFRHLAHDLAAQKERIPDAAAPVVLYALTCLEYRCVPLLPALLDAIERHLSLWRTEVLSLVLHCLATLGIAAPSGGSGGSGSVTFEVEGHSPSRDYGHLGTQIIRELGGRLEPTSPLGEFATDTLSLQDWSRTAYAMVTAGLQDETTPSGSPILPVIVERACKQISGKDILDNSGWAQFFLYQTLYCVDVEKPSSEEMVKRAMPMWIQERLHQRWLDSIVLRAQPQGADNLQRDVDEALRRTNTQALLNCSCGRDWDEQHCWFAGFLLEPKTAVECDSMLPLAPGRPRSSGFQQLKGRILRKIGYSVVTIHKSLWQRLTEDQKDEQIMRLRAEVSYVHNKDLEERRRRIRQQPHTYKGIERKSKEWKVVPEEPPPPAE